MTTTSRDIAVTANRAATAAMAAAVRSPGGHTISVGDLLGGLISLFRAQTSMATATPGVRDAAIDMLAIRLAIELVQLTGARRAHELVDEAARVGAGADFQ